MSLKKRDSCGFTNSAGRIGAHIFPYKIARKIARKFTRYFGAILGAEFGLSLQETDRALEGTDFAELASSHPISLHSRPVSSLSSSLALIERSPLRVHR